MVAAIFPTRLLPSDVGQLVHRLSTAPPSPLRQSSRRASFLPLHCAPNFGVPSLGCIVDSFVGLGLAKHLASRIFAYASCPASRRSSVCLELSDWEGIWAPGWGGVAGTSKQVGASLGAVSSQQGPHTGVIPSFLVTRSGDSWSDRPSSEPGMTLVI